MILILLSTLKAWLNNETPPGEEQIYQLLLTPRLWPVSLSFSCLSSKPPVFLFFRDKWSLYNISHIEVGWHEDLFLWLFVSARQRNSSLSYFSFGAQEEGFWLKRTHCVSFVTNDILHEKGSTCLSSKWKKNDTGVSNIRLVFCYCG